MTNLDCQSRESPMDLHDHCHTYAHILLPLSDSLTVTMGDKEYTLSSQHLGFIAPMQYHRCRCSANIIIMNIPENMIHKEDLDVLGSQIVMPLEGNLITLVNLIKAEVMQNPNDRSISYLYYFLYDKLVKTNGIKSVQYIKNNFEKNITVSQLAKIENYNTTYFGDWFKKKTGYTPSGYLRCVRMDKAKELLQHSGYRLIEIAIQVGYNSNASFTRAFKQSEGITPIDFRNMFTNNKR